MAMNLEAWTQKIKKFSKDTMTEVQKMNEIRLLSSRVNEEKKKINAVYTEMGKKLYEMYKEQPFEGFEAEFQSIEQKFTLIDLLKDQIRGVKGVVLCECCNTEVGIGERFCSNCGCRMPEVPVLDETEEAVEGEVELEDLEDDEIEVEDLVDDEVEFEDVVEAEAAEGAEEAEVAEEAAEEVKAEVAEEAADEVEAEVAEEAADEVEADVAEEAVEETAEVTEE